MVQRAQNGLPQLFGLVFIAAAACGASHDGSPNNPVVNPDGGAVASADGATSAADGSTLAADGAASHTDGSTAAGDSAPQLADAGAGGSDGAGGPTDTTSCSPVQVTCVDGDHIDFCTVSHWNPATGGGGCVDAYFTYKGVTYDCGGCSDCTVMYEPALETCQHTLHSCDDLKVCCDSMPDPTIQPSSQKNYCLAAYNHYSTITGGAYSCKNALASYESKGLCP